MDPIELRFEVACSPEHAFQVWATRTSLWWPHSHSRSGEPGLTVTFEPRPGGRVFERTPGGVEHDWGEVVAWERRAASPTSGTSTGPGRTPPDPTPPPRTQGGLAGVLDNCYR
jgi:hypothetical protein